MKSSNRTFGVVVISLFGALGVAAQGCTEVSVDPPRDGGADAADTSIEPSDDASPGNDASRDAGPSDHPPSGYTAVTSSVDPRTGSELAMTVDAHDDPLFAYLEYWPGSDEPTLVFVQWDSKAKRFTVPVAIDQDGVGLIAARRAGHPISIAYDATTNRVAVAYQKIVRTTSSSASTVWLASASLAKSSSGYALPATFVASQISEGASLDASPAAQPSVGMAGGKTFVAYSQKNWQCCPHDAPTCATCDGVWLVESAPPPAVDAGAGDAAVDGNAATDAADAGDAGGDATLSSNAVDGGADVDPDAGAADAEGDASDAGGDADATSEPPAPPVLTRTLLHYGGAPARVRTEAPISLAIDSAGDPGVVFFAPSGVALAGGGQGTEIFFWRKGMLDALEVRDSGNARNDSFDVSLRFDGTLPRFVASLATDDTPASEVSLSVSSDGARWGGPIPIVPQKMPPARFAASLAIGEGALAVAAHVDCTSPCNDLYIATSTNGVDWSPIATDGRYGASSLNIAYGATAAKGQLMVGFHASNFSHRILPRTTPSAVIFWKE